MSLLLLSVCFLSFCAKNNAFFATDRSTTVRANRAMLDRFYPVYRKSEPFRPRRYVQIDDVHDVLEQTYGDNSRQYDIVKNARWIGNLFPDSTSNELMHRAERHRWNTFQQPRGLGVLNTRQPYLQNRRNAFIETSRAYSPVRKPSKLLSEYVQRSNALLTNLTVHFSQFWSYFKTKQQLLIWPPASISHSELAFQRWLRSFHSDLTSSVKEISKFVDDTGRFLEGMNYLLNSFDIGSNNNRVSQARWMKPFSDLQNITFGSKFYFPELQALPTEKEKYKIN